MSACSAWPLPPLPWRRHAVKSTPNDRFPSPRRSSGQHRRQPRQSRPKATAPTYFASKWRTRAPRPRCRESAPRERTRSEIASYPPASMPSTLREVQALVCICSRAGPQLCACTVTGEQVAFADSRRSQLSQIEPHSREQHGASALLLVCGDVARCGELPKLLVLCLDALLDDVKKYHELEFVGAHCRITIGVCDGIPCRWRRRVVAFRCHGAVDRLSGRDVDHPLPT